MVEIPFGSMPGYAMTQGPDKEYIKKNKEDRRQLSWIRRDIKEHYIASSKCSKFWVTKKEIDQWLQEDKLRKKLFKWKYYYNQEDLMRLLNIKISN